MRPCHFSFDTDEVFEGLTDGTTWNGFLNVWTTPEVREQILTAFEALGEDPETVADIRALPVDDRGLVSFAHGYATQEVGNARCADCGALYMGGGEHACRLIPDGARFTLDGEAVDVDDFIEENGFAMPDVEQIASVAVGAEIIYGGGAAPERVLRRVR